MKKKLVLLASIALISTALSSCQYFVQFGSDGVHFLPGLNSNGPQSIVDVSTPPAGEIVANTAQYTYQDYTNNNVYSLSVTPSKGTASLLVIPLWFNDSSNFISVGQREAVREDIQKSYFGTDKETGWKSVKTYYEQESLGALTINGRVSDWYEVDSSFLQYSVDTPTKDNGAPKTTALVEQATNWYFDSNTSDRRSNYDHNGDGFLDGVIVIYAAPDLQTYKRDDYSNLWAYCFWIQKTDSSHKSALNPGVNAFFWASFDYMYGSDMANTRTGTSGRYGAGDTKNCNLDTHTYIHEMGHMFGLEDYYDYSTNGRKGEGYKPAAGFSMQDHNVGGHDPFSSYALGWGKAYVPTDSINIDLKPFSTSGEMILLKPDAGNSRNPFDEYLLLEYFTPQGLNEFDVKHQYMKNYGKNYPNATMDFGIRLWHVDARLIRKTGSTWRPTDITNDVTQKNITLVMSNSYDDGQCTYISVLGASYADYNLLQLIRNDVNATYYPEDNFVSGFMFKANDKFEMSKYSKQFVNQDKLNSSKRLGFSFTVNACNNEYASISIVKE